jgi:hypothetical protein
VAFSDAGFGLTISLSRRAPLQGFARRLQTKPRVIRNKGFIFGNVLHFTEPNEDFLGFCHKRLLPMKPQRCVGRLLRRQPFGVEE